MTKSNLRELIIFNYEDLLWSLSPNEHGDEPSEAFPDIKTQEETFDLLREDSKLSLPVVDDVIKRYLEDQKLTETSHPDIKGIDIYKQAGFLTFWIVKLKPIMNLVEVPTKTDMLINEQLAISVTYSLLYAKHGQEAPFSLKIIDDLKYTLRYRINTRHGLALLYESLCRYFDYPSYNK